jgi:hypothetical protein
MRLPQIHSTPLCSLPRPSAAVSAACGASAGLRAGRLGAIPHNSEHRFRNPVHSGGGGRDLRFRQFLPIIRTGKRAASAEHDNTTTQKQREGKQDKRTISRKNGPTQSGRQANEKHQAANARAGESGRSRGGSDGAPSAPRRDGGSWSAGLTRPKAGGRRLRGALRTGAITGPSTAMPDPE